MSLAASSFRSLLQRLLLLRTAMAVVAIPLGVFIDVRLLALKERELPVMLSVLVPVALVLLAVLQPVLVTRLLLKQAVREEAGQDPALRLRRLLQLPARLAFLEYLASWLLGGIFLNGCVALLFGRPPTVVAVGVAVALSAGLVTAPLLLMLYEHALMPLTLEAFGRTPGARRRARGLLMPRQLWLLPLMVVAALLTTCLAGMVSAWLELTEASSGVAAQLAAVREVQVAAEVQALLAPLAARIAGQVAWVAGLVALLSIVTAWWSARRQQRAAAAVGVSLKALVDGRAAPPAWVSTDEVGDLAAHTWRLYASLQELPRALQASVDNLARAGEHLTRTRQAQDHTLGRQAAALQQAQATAEEIQVTSRVAADRAGEVLAEAERARALGQEGEEVLARTGQGLEDIRTTSEDIHRRVSELGRRVSEVGRVTGLVKGLADQSHMLALNAAIEATRAGEHGKGFGVVAREMRTLADQSIRATLQVRELVEGMARATGDAVEMADRGSAEVERALAQLSTGGERLRALAQLAQETARSVRQIAEAVGQQHAGVGQLFAAMRELNAQMEATLQHLAATEDAAATFSEATGQVSTLARRYVA